MNPKPHIRAGEVVIAEIHSPDFNWQKGSDVFPAIARDKGSPSRLKRYVIHGQVKRNQVGHSKERKQSRLANATNLIS